MKIAVVNPYPVHGRAVGGVTRLNGLVRHLAQRHEVTVFTHSSGAPGADREAVDDLRLAGVTQRIFPLPRAGPARKLAWALGPDPYFVSRNRNPDLERALARQASEDGLDVVHVEFAYLAPLLAGAGRQAVRGLCEQETMSLAVERLRAVPSGSKSLYERYIPRELGKIERFEARALRGFDVAFGISEPEAARMSARSGREVGVLPHVVSGQAFTPGPAEPEDEAVLFVGNFGHSPNLHGALWFVEEVWPAVRAGRPRARLEIVGPGLEARARERITRAGGEVRGRIDDLPAAYRAAAVFVNPMLSGGGMRGKVLEAFACGRPVVSTPLGMEGIAARQGEHFLSATEAASFAAAVVRYLGEPALRRAHGQAARRLVEERYDAPLVFATLEDAYAEAVRERKARGTAAAPSSSPRISAQVVTWNSAAVIEACLTSVQAQTYAEVETIVVDNASRDGSADKAEAFFRRGLRGHLVRETENRGFCGGNNDAFARAQGDWILFLNPDTVLPPRFLESAAAVLASADPDVGSVAPCLLLPDGRVDSTGLVLDRYRRAYDRGRGEGTAAAYQREEDVFACTGAVAFHRRAMLEDVAVEGHPLDESLFAYYDDIDLAWRASLLGWRCRYVPTLVATHERGARNSLRGLGGRVRRGRDQMLTVRNRFLVMAKCERPRDVLRDLPWLLPFEVARLAFLALRAPGALSAYPRALAALPAALRARRVLQARARRQRTLP